MSDRIGILISGQLNETDTLAQINRQISTLQSQVRNISIGVSSNNVSQQIRPVVNQLNNVASAANNARARTQGFFSAFGKVVQWGVVTTAVYGTIRALKSMVSEIVNVDTALTELRRVTASGFDISGTLQDSIKLSSELGNNLNDVLQTVNDIARAGDFTEQQIIDLTRTATIASNVSDLKPQDAMTDLIAVMRAYRLEASQTIDVVDKMNEVDNNFSISTQQIADALKRTSATASTFGVDINHVISDITAIGEVTQETGGVLGNSLKTIYSRLTTVSSSINTLKDLGIAIKNSNGEMRSASDILDDLASHWSSLSKAQQEQSAVAIAGRYQLSRFLALMTNHDQEVKALTTSIESQGSAMRENEKYQDSMIAKINRMKNAFAEMGLAIGKTFLNDTFISLVQGLGSVAKAVSSLVDTFGGLPVLATATYAAFLLFGGAARRYVTTMTLVNSITQRFRNIQGSTSALFSMMRNDIAAETAGLSGMASATRGATVAVRTLGVAFRGALIASGIGIAIVAITYGIQKLMEYTAKQREEAKKLQEEETQLATSYKNHKDEIAQLAEKYELLSSQVASGDLSANDKEYLDVQTQLDKLLPSVTASIDDQGQAHLKSADAVKSEIAYVKQLTTLKAADFVDNFQKKLSDLNDKIDETKKKTKTSNESFSYGSTPGSIKVEKTPLTNKDRLDNLVNNERMKALVSQRQDLLKQLATNYEDSIEISDKLTKSDQDMINSFIENDKKLKDQIKNNQFDQAQTSIEDYINAISKLRAVTNDSVDLSKITLGLSTGQIQQLAMFIGQFKNGSMTISKFNNILAKNGYTTDQIITITNALTDAKLKNEDATKAQIDAQDTLNKVLNGSLSAEDALTQSLLGYTKDQIDSNSKLIEIYAALSKAKNLDANQSALLTQVYDELKSRFPDLVKGHEISVNALYGEANAQSVLYQAVIASANGQLDAEHQKTLGMAQELMNQKKIVEAQIALYQKGLDAYVASEMVQNNGRFAMNGAMMANYHRIQDMANQVDNVIVPKIQKAAISLGKYLNVSPQFKTPDWNYDTSKSGSKGTKPTTADTQKVNKYATDAFSQALAKLDLQIKESDARLNDLDKSSKEYRDELAHQIDLIEQEEKLTKDQINSLNKKNETLKHQLSAMGAYNKLSNDQKNTYNDIAKAIDDNINKINDLSGAMVDYGNKVKDIQSQVLDSFSAVSDMITNNINTAMQASDDSYDSQIKKLQEKLDLMDQEYAKEDRIAKLRDIQNEIDSVKADKRFEFITADGQKILTYDKAKVSDLEKQQDDLIQQYNREDAKQAIQDQIDLLQEAKDNQHKIFEQQIQDVKDFWDEFTNGVKDGTITFDDLMNGKDGFYSKSLDALSAYGINVQSLVGSIAQAFASLGNLSISSPSLQNQEDYLKNLKQNGTSGQSKWANDQLYYLDLYKNGTSGQQAWAKKHLQFHDGGIIGKSTSPLSDTVNKLFNTKPNEQVVKALVGEVMIPPKNIMQNFIPNMQKVLNFVRPQQMTPVSADNHYHFDHVEVKANNLTEFLKDIHFMASTRRT